jgi:hypothetical protein
VTSKYDVALLRYLADREYQLIATLRDIDSSTCLDIWQLGNDTIIVRTDEQDKSVAYRCATLTANQLD